MAYMLKSFKQFCGKTTFIYENVFNLHDAVRIHEPVENIIPHLKEEKNILDAFEISIMFAYSELLNYILKKYKNVVFSKTDMKDDSWITVFSGLFFSDSIHYTEQDIIKTIDVLLKYKIINPIFSNGFLLCSSTQANKNEVVKYLLKKGANPDKKYNNLTSFDLACTHGFTEIVKSFLPYNPKITKETINSCRKASGVKKLILDDLAEKFSDNPMLVSEYSDIWSVLPEYFTEQYKDYVEFDYYTKVNKK